MRWLLALLISTFVVFPVSAQWPGADFPSDAWKSSPREWYIQWKRVRKYARIAVVTHQEQGLDPLTRQARQLYLQIWRWPDGALKNTCYPAAHRLNDAIKALSARNSDGLQQLQISEIDGDRCLAAINSPNL